MEIVTASHKHLLRIAQCHIHAFPASLSSLLGPRYTAKMLEWYLTSDNKFLFHIEADGRVVGYCGGFVRKGEPYGSSSGMTQYAFREGIRALLLRPWLVFHPKVRGNFRFLGRNLWYRVFPPSAQPAAGDNSSHSHKVAQSQSPTVIQSHSPTVGDNSSFVQSYSRKVVQSLIRRAGRHRRRSGVSGQGPRLPAPPGV